MGFNDAPRPQRVKHEQVMTDRDRLLTEVVKLQHSIIHACNIGDFTSTKILLDEIKSKIDILETERRNEEK